MTAFKIVFAFVGLSLLFSSCGDIPCPRFITYGEMSVDPVSIQATGNDETSVSIFVYRVCEAVFPDGNPHMAEVEFYSSRNVVGDMVDNFNPRVAITGAGGLAETRLSSSTPGEAVIGAFVDGDLLCDIEAISKEECLSPVAEIVEFTSP